MNSSFQLSLPTISTKSKKIMLRQHKKAIGWKLSDLPGINPSICMHRILMEEEVNHQTPCCRDHLPYSDSQWVSPMQVVPKKSGMTVARNQYDELRVCIDYRRLNQATRKDHFPLPFIDQTDSQATCKSILHLKTSTKQPSHPIWYFAYTHMPFGLCNALSTFQRCMISIFSDLLQDYMEVFMDEFT
ncbi:Retrovirus-related Pol polyprotein, partial [Mucuna pruriens]